MSKLQCGNITTLRMKEQEAEVISRAQQDQSSVEGCKEGAVASGSGTPTTPSVPAGRRLVDTQLPNHLPSYLLTCSWCFLLIKPNWKKEKGITQSPYPINAGVTQLSDFHQFNRQEGVAPCCLNGIFWFLTTSNLELSSCWFHFYPCPFLNLSPLFYWGCFLSLIEIKPGWIPGQVTKIPHASGPLNHW